VELLGELLGLRCREHPGGQEPGELEDVATHEMLGFAHEGITDADVEPRTMKDCTGDLLVTPLEQLFRFVVEHHRRSRNPHGLHEARATHTGSDLGHGYEGLIRGVGAAAGRDVEALASRLAIVDPGFETTR